MNAKKNDAGSPRRRKQGFDPSNAILLSDILVFEISFLRFFFQLITDIGFGIKQSYPKSADVVQKRRTLRNQWGDSRRNP